MLQFDLQRIRKEQKITQLVLSQMIGYPQSFISKIERGTASAPVALIKKVQEVFGIENIEPYVKDDLQIKEEAMRNALGIEAPPEPMAKKDREAKLFEMLERRDARIEKLEAENDRLRQELDELRALRKHWFPYLK